MTQIPEDQPIPQDIFETAASYAQHYMASPEKRVPGFLTHLFEQAILAERERILAIVREVRDTAAAPKSSVAVGASAVLDVLTRP